MTNYLELLHVEDQFDLNELYIIADKMYKKFKSSSDPINIRDWNEQLKALFYLVNETNKTFDLCEGFVDKNDLEAFKTNGIELPSYVVISNDNIKSNLYYDKNLDLINLELSFNFKEAIDMLVKLPKSTDKIKYEWNQIGKNSYLLKIKTNPITLIHEALNWMQTTILAENLDYLFKKIKEDYLKNGLQFTYANQYLITKIDYICEEIILKIKLDSTMINSAAVNSLFKNSAKMEKVITKSIEHLESNLSLIAKYFELLTYKYVLINNSNN